VRFISCTYEQQGDAIREILNDAILHTTALYDYKTRSRESVRSWFQAKEAGPFPIIGAVDDEQRLLGFASYGTFRVYSAYKYTVEHSVYVHRDQRGKGVGLALMERLIQTARQQQYHVMVGGIDTTNAASIALHLKLGFFHAGTIRQAAYKFGRWLDLAFYQLILETPTAPVEG
jgi:phosphinothricin acetyltransferase